MGYEDFVWFILSEEDKSNDLSLEYWFRCVDLDCDGCLRSSEMLVCLSSTPVLKDCQSYSHRAVLQLQAHLSVHCLIPGLLRGRRRFDNASTASAPIWLSY